MNNKKLKNYIIVYNAGAYGNFVGWSLDWLSNKVPLYSRPWHHNGTSHNNNLIYYNTVDDACIQKETGIVHPILNDTDKLVDVFDRLHESFDKIVFLYPDSDSMFWSINNKFEKVFNDGWFTNNPEYILKNMPYWSESPDTVSTWQMREWLSFFILDQHLCEIRNSEITTINNNNQLLKVSLSNLRDDTASVFKEICNFLEIDMLRSNDQIDNLVTEWANLQLHKHKDNLIIETIDAIISNNNIEFDKSLTLIDQSEIQRHLRSKFGIQIKCYGLNTWPKYVNELTTLLYKDDNK